MGYNIAIDGPAGAGKSTIARQVAKELGYIYVDTGAMYRAMAVHFIKMGLRSDDKQQIVEACSNANITITYENEVQQVYLNNENITLELRSEIVGKMASISSAIPEVRAHLLELQIELAKTKNVVMDGRDIGTYVLPNADVKIFLTASPESRAMRRYKELKEKGASVGYDEVLADLKERDYNDSHRKIAPLKPAKDSITVDTTLFTLEESIKKITDIIREHM